ncbi:hypothetical protein [Halomonas salipaludis]|uniref:Lipoprotein n=1 Tax=Halomonas salipaludis TaxID=2032625 RepID=A0A2A2EUN5_9GAMM|nr:hypothetical protein [Halomonas salipaludis]PAU76067.1 hypothetical protein CK498_14265 [Halomonas salipaludis]
MIKKLLLGLLLITMIVGCTNQSDKLHTDLLEGSDPEIKIILVDENYFFDLRWSDEDKFNEVVAELKEREGLSDDMDFFFSQFFASIPFYGEAWSEHFADRLLFYVEGSRHISLMHFSAVIDEQGRRINVGHQQLPSNHTLEIHLLQDKSQIEGDLRVMFLRAEDRPSRVIEFTIPSSALPRHASDQDGARKP